MQVLIRETAEEGSRIAAELVARAIRENPATRLGLAAGKTPIGLYGKLVELHQSNTLDFSSVHLFSLDEFIGLPSQSPNSYATFFHHYLVDHIPIERGHLHLLNGETTKDMVAYCAMYEQLIRNLGGIDLQILGVGLNGHLGFNEPGSSLDSRTRLTLLSASTRENLVRDFNRAPVPEWAITMGLGTIREARALLVLAFGPHKAEIIAKSVEEPVSASIPASCIQLHSNVTVLLDREAASSLTNQAYG
jgi:glucosamine-6-phosphate deaminase